ncbi:transcriptional regulator [Murinocardiopsis flavida]|uniref:Transcriptional regulator n=1 Tax=Murinocardiopsis flavida TaxID=645275 RepID=A0A2P8DS14_9ACTN|nr:transcriptional regulator [Murinocardiopsis flavida]
MVAAVLPSAKWTGVISASETSLRRASAKCSLLATPVVAALSPPPSSFDQFRAELDDIRRQGWAYSVDERVVGAASVAASVAAPVAGPGGSCDTAVQVAGPSTAPAFEDREALSVEVRQAAMALSARLG